MRIVLGTNVTGDRDLTDLQKHEGVTILTPSEFWQFENEAANPGGDG